MRLFDRFKKFIACVILTAFVPSQAWAQGINIPSGSTLNLNTGTLTVPGNITNAGTLSATTGAINLNGNWANSGTFNSGTGTVYFNAASGTQTLTSGGSGASDAFYNLTHNAAGTVQLSTNAVTINDDFTNTAGTFNAAGENMNVGVNWENSATFTNGNNTVTLNGTNQWVLGSTSFYNFSKVVSSGGPYTLTFDASGTQDFTGSLTMQGNSSENMLIRSTTSGTTNTPAAIALTLGRPQSINDVDVKDSNAGTSGVQETLVGRGNSVNSGDNQNWLFGNTTITWTGSTSTEWNDPTNWSPSLVPAAGDTVIIPGGTTNEVNLCPATPVYTCGPVTVGNLTVGSGASASTASLTLSGENLTVSTAFSNSGNVVLEGTEVLTLTMDSTHGTFTYVGQDGSSSVTHTLTINGSHNVAYNNLVIDDTNATQAHRDVFAVNTTNSLTVNGNLTVTSGTLDASASGVTIADTGSVTIAGAGVLKAPPSTSATAFTVGGNWTNNGGTFTAENGQVTLNAANGTTQEVLGSTAFYDFSKIVTGASTLTFDHTGTQTFSNSLTLQGASSQLLTIDSDSSGHAAAIALSPTGAQSIDYVYVQDSNAGTSPTQQTLVARTSPDHSNFATYDNTNWDFGTASITWTGSNSSEWNNTLNWSPMVVPSTGDTVIIPGGTTNEPNLCPSTHVNTCGAVTVGNLTVGSGASASTASLTLSAESLTVSTSFSNSGNVVLEGTEVLTLNMDSTHGTFTYVGVDGSSSAAHTLTINGSNNVAYNNLVIDDTNATPADRDVFAVNTNNSLTVTSSLAVTSGTLDASASGATIADTGSVTIASAGILKAPSSTSATAFTVGGNWTNNGGTFTADSGQVTFNGANGTTQEVLGSTTFYDFSKTNTAAATLTFDATSGTQQTFANGLTLTGPSSPNFLTINSTTTGTTNTQAYIALNTGGTQNITDVDVFYSNASRGLLLVARNTSQDGPPAGTNTNWSFGNATLTWTGGTSTAWNNPNNWNLGLAPVNGDSVIIPGGTTYEPVLSSTVTLTNLTIGSVSASTASLTLAGNGLTVTGTFTNKGNVILEGTESVSLTQDTSSSDAGTFTYVGVGGGSSATHTLAISGSDNVSYYNLVIDDPNATPADRDVFATNGTLTVDGTLTVTSGTLNASNSSSSIAANGAVTIGTSGILDAPGTGAFDIAGNFTNNSTGGNGFVNSSGTVTLTTTTTATITGNTTFYNLASTAAGKTIQFTAGSDQTVAHNLNLDGARGSLISLVSTTTSSPWSITLSGGAQNVGELSVEDSDALTNTVTCINCTDVARNNANWIFATLAIDSPASATTVGQTPTIIGTASASSTVYIRDISGNLVATAKSDANGNFRVAVGQDAAKTNLTITAQLATGANSLTPYLTSTPTNPGLVNSVTVVASPTTAQVPTITSLNGNAVTNTNATQFINGNTPAIAGQGAVGASVTAQALDANGNLIETATLGTVAGSGSYSVTWPSATPLPSATNYLTVTVGSSANETSSAIIEVSLTDPFGVVYNSATNQPIQSATVTLYNATTKQAATGVQSCNAAGTCCDTSGNCCNSGVCTAGNPSGNPFTTGADGFYSFLAPSGQYYINVSAAGFTYPSVSASVPSGRSVITGSKGQDFTVGSSVFEIDLPMDGNSSLLHITKTANKSQAMIGDIVMYTVNIQNMSSTNPVTNVFLNDEIPPGFKYIKDRVLLNGTPISEPTGQRPLLFNIGTVAPSTTVVLQYQLVIGAGVSIMGNYQNTATARYPTGTIISNPTQASVKIVPDPIFDMGTVIGKVFYDWNQNGIQDPPFYDPISHQTVVEGPVGNVQIIMEDGTIITTDRNGQFDIPNLLPGRHLFRLDERTLPPGAYLTTSKGVIVDVTAGSIFKVNFGVNIDQSQAGSRDAMFFNQKLRLTQDSGRPVPRLNAAIFDASAGAKADTEEVLIYQGEVVRKAEFRIFTNYSTFMGSWRLDIMDADTAKTVRSFEGTPLNINDPIYWNGQDDHGVLINTDHKYSYVLSVFDDKGHTDTTKEKQITIREIKDDVGLKKEQDESKDVLKDRADRYRKWLDAQGGINNIDRQTIMVQGATIHIDRQGTDVKSIRIMKGNQLFTDLPLTQQYGLTPDELVAGGFSQGDEKDNLEIILPNGDYNMDVVSVKAVDDASQSSAAPGVEEVTTVPAPGMPSSTSPAGTLEHYSRPLKVGDDYMLFVALGDAQVGYNIDRGNIEPIQDATEEPGFYKEGKAAYYLKGQILGKYLITSSFDSDRAQKALFRQLDPNTYYPVYGDESSVNFDATDTQGPLYLLVQWDKSSALLGNFAVNFSDTDFAAFSQSYYGGKLDYQSVATNPYGDARTKLVVYHAQVQQLPSHNEFLATGGSLYFLKYQNVIQGSDTVTIQVRDETTGLVVASQTMVNGADYELDNSQGSILFWQPVAMIAQSENIISNNLVNGDPIYVVVDYQYAVAGMQLQGAQGARVAQAIGDNVVLGGTYVQDNSSGQNYTLEGTDATLHVNKDSTIKAEYAQSTSQEEGSYVSTDGGITFTPLMLNSTATGRAYGIKGDTRLFDNIGLKAYYKWIGNDFGATDTTYQQGKEMTGLSMVFDMTPVTRLTASEDIQKLLAGGNLQTSTQVGASETDTTMIQIVHQAEKLKLTGEFQLTETKSVVNGIESTTNQRGSTFAGQAQYDITNRIKATVGQQVDVENPANTATTVGVADRVTDMTTINALETFSSQGHALTAGMTNQLNKRIALTTDYTLTNLDTGEVDKTASVGVTDQMTKNISTTGTVAQTASSTGTNTTAVSVGTKAKISDNLSLAANVGQTANALGQSTGGTSVQLNGTDQIGNTTVTGIAATNVGTAPSDALGIGTTGISTVSSVGVQAVTKVDENNTANGSVTVGNESSGDKETTFGFGNTSKIDQELQAVTDNSFSFSPDNGTSNSSKYGLVRDTNGLKSEADYTQQSDILPGSVSDSNIFGLSGDVNDRLAVNGSVESGKVQNLDSSQTDRTDFSVGTGYVLKDTESAVAKFQNSLKLELRLDKGIGTDSLHQYVVYDAMQGKINDNWTVNAKLDYSKTLDVTSGAVAERHQEIILGMAYRPVNFDNLNFITEYSYQDGYGGGTQQADALNTNVMTTKAQVFSAEAVYDINDKWQAAEKAALRVEDEEDTGFAFTETHTWLVIQRLSYKADPNWTISGEYRDLVQNEAKDFKQGFLFEATRTINDNTQLTVGWNFTDYTDDLTNLSYTSMGPFVRMDGKFYDETPEERARERAKWLDAKISQWAWVMIKKELSKKDSKIVLELNRMFIMASAAQKAGRLQESQQIYKDIITAGQMMFDEACEYIRGRVAFEEQMKDLDKTAWQYYKGGEYVRARKIWEKVVEDASKGMVK